MAKKQATGATKKTDDPTREELPFEATVERLEEIVGELEQGETDLDRSLARFEEGVRLMRRAHALLADAERKIVLLTDVDNEGNAVTEPLNDASLASDGTTPGRSPRGGA